MCMSLGLLLGQDSGVGVLVSRGHTLQHSAGGLFGSEMPLLFAGCVEEKQPGFDYEWTLQGQ